MTLESGTELVLCLEVGWGVRHIICTYADVVSFLLFRFSFTGVLNSPKQISYMCKLSFNFIY